MGLQLPLAVLTSRCTNVAIQRRDIVIHRGNDVTLDLTVWPDDFAASPVDAVGAQAELVLVRHRENMPSGGINWGWDYGWDHAGWGLPHRFEGVPSTDPSSGAISVFLPSAQTSEMRGRYDMILFLSLLDGLQDTIMCGVLDVRHAPTFTIVYCQVSVGPGILTLGAVPPLVPVPQPNYILLDNGTVLAADSGAPLVYDAVLPDLQVQPPTPQIATFTVTITPIGPRPCSVNWSTVDGTATVAAGDYTASSGTLSWTQGQGSQTVAVPVRPYDPTKRASSFGVVLSGAVNCTLGTFSNFVYVPGAFVLDFSPLDGPDVLPNGIFALNSSVLDGYDVLAAGSFTLDASTLDNGDTL